jgi:DNA-binding MarR family transcriptional regulator
MTSIGEDSLPQDSEDPGIDQGPQALFDLLSLPEAHERLKPEDLELLRRQRLLARRYLPFLKTLADFDIAAEIGFHELSGVPLTVKQLLLLDLAPPVTIFRRLQRLCDIGVVVRTQSTRDRRVHELRLTPAMHQLLACYSSGTATELTGLSDTPLSLRERRWG